MADRLDPVLLSHTYRDVELVSAFVEMFMNGLYTTLVAFTFYTVATRKTFRGSNIPLMTVIGIMYAMCVIHLGVHASYVRAAFITYGDTSATVFNYFLTPTPLAIVGDVMAVSMASLADAILCWRVYVVWARNWRPIILPIILTLISTAFGILLIVIAHDPVLQTNIPWASQVATIYYALILCTTVVSTLLIAGRILHLGGTPGLSRYWHVLEVVVESAALYAIILIIYLPYIVSLDVIKSLPVYIIQSVVVPMTGIAPTLIVTRVALGINAKDSTWNPPLHSPSGGDLQFGTMTTLSKGVTTNASHLNTGGLHTEGTETKYSSLDSPTITFADVPKISVAV